MISIHAPEDPDATLRHCRHRPSISISIHAPEDPDATANNGLVKPLQNLRLKLSVSNLLKRL